MIVKLELIRVPYGKRSKVTTLLTYLETDYITLINECDMEMIEDVSGLSNYIAENGYAPSDLTMIEMVNDRCYFTTTKIKNILKKIT